MEKMYRIRACYGMNIPEEYNYKDYDNEKDVLKVFSNDVVTFTDITPLTHAGFVEVFSYPDNKDQPL